MLFVCDKIGRSYYILDTDTWEISTVSDAKLVSMLKSGIKIENLNVRCADSIMHSHVVVSVTHNRTYKVRDKITIGSPIACLQGRNILIRKEYIECRLLCNEYYCKGYVKIWDSAFIFNYYGDVLINDEVVCYSVGNVKYFGIDKDIFVLSFEHAFAEFYKGYCEFNSFGKSAYIDGMDMSISELRRKFIL